MSDDSDDSAVMVDHNDAPPELTDEKDAASKETAVVDQKKPADTSNKDDKKENEEYSVGSSTAQQILSVGTEDDAYAFTFHKEKWAEVLGLVPPGWKVAVVSVVGAFRTGKSFLLSWFLRYLYALERAQKNNQSLDDDSETPWYKQFDSVGKDGFDWKAGTERNTTGIWMWSHPFFLKNKDGEDMAVLLVDTQGMFDHETTMALTASIFGLSTLLSSYQIYNVDKRIQEDNLQQLALFSEFARTAMGEGDFERKPFQKIEFLVRDWQHFEDEDENEDFNTMETSMVEYLAGVLADRAASDLKDTREQIQTCFEEISCYALCHPGFAVTKKKYSGDVAALEELFVKLLDRYCKRVFSTASLQPKQIHDRELSAVELGTYIEAYAELFASGANFPTAATLLEATANANNNNAETLAVAEYKDHMGRVSGPKCSNYIKPQELQEENESAQAKAMKVFRSIATFGSRKSVEVSEQKVLLQMNDQWQLYESLNEGRNPLLGLETYLIPMAMAFFAYILRIMTDFTCSPYSDVCKAGSEVLSHTYAVVFCFMLILAATKMKQIQEMMSRLKAALQLVLENHNVDQQKKFD
mmetsp:Transcript_891/g.1180  ORF Transcript_891/g.1180 Transcript_891/m.1180 type:complete len:584 (-) Transcript_891:1038-2789(-)